jgi:hypothetical protein
MDLDGLRDRMLRYGLFESIGPAGTGGTTKPTDSRVLICGDRNWAAPERPGNQIDHLLRIIDTNLLFDTMDAFDEVWGIKTVIHGKAPGADSEGGEWALFRGKRPEAYPALWSQHDSYDRKCWCKDKTLPKCRGAGPIRNIEMLERGQPNFVVAFHRNLPASRGTKHMVSIARKAGLPVFVIPDYAIY